MIGRVVRTFNHASSATAGSQLKSARGAAGRGGREGVRAFGIRIPRASMFRLTRDVRFLKGRSFAPPI